MANIDIGLLKSIVESLVNQRGETKTKVFINSGVGKDFFSNLNKGQMPSAEKIISLADYLGVSVDYLLGREDNRMKSYNNTDTHLDEMSATLLDDFSKLETAEKARVIVMIDDMKKAKENKK